MKVLLCIYGSVFLLYAQVQNKEKNSTPAKKKSESLSSASSIEVFRNVGTGYGGLLHLHQLGPGTGEVYRTG